jgi:O-acetyl-ADP-ribose deacetylase (regulator of RNase III)
MTINVELTRERLPFLDVEAIGYGAKDTGEMGGGAASAIVAAAGAELIDAVRVKLAKTDRRVGDAVVTDAFGLRKSGIKCICHIVSIITRTSQGDWCPYPDKLYDGTKSGLRQVLEAGAQSIAISALATGEGRVKPEDAARLMLTAVRDFQREPANRKLKIVFSLPTYEDYEAFESFYCRM